MFFDSVAEIPKIAARVGTAIFVLPREEKVEIPGALIIKPEEKTLISIEQLREMSAKVEMRQTRDIYVVIRPAEKMTVAAANSLLKTLEQPGEKVHFVLMTDQIDQILPTIISRAEVYFLRPRGNFLSEVAGDAQQKTLAKRLMVARGADLVQVAAEITKKRDGVQQYALEVLRLAIEMSYKAYFSSKKAVFLKKIPKIIAAYENISLGGNIKLQIVANLC